MNEPNINLGRLLFNKRTEKGLSLREFCEGLGISHAYLNKLEKGVDPRTGKDVTPTIETLSKIAAGVNMPLQELLGMCGYLDSDEGIQSRSLEISEDEDELVITLENLVKEVNDAIDSAGSITFKGKQINAKSRILELIGYELIKSAQTTDEDEFEKN